MRTKVPPGFSAARVWRNMASCSVISWYAFTISAASSRPIGNFGSSTVPLITSTFCNPSSLQTLLELEELGVTDIFRVHLAGWSEKTGQWNCVETVSASHISSRVSGPQVERFHDALLQVAGTILLRPWLRRLTERATDDQQQQNGASHEGVGRRSGSKCAENSRVRHD